jgi:hypothetical protein
MNPDPVLMDSKDIAKFDPAGIPQVGITVDL